MEYRILGEFVIAVVAFVVGLMFGLVAGILLAFKERGRETRH